jgi:hypothetical protein
VTFTPLTVSGALATLTGSPATISGGQASVTAVANDTNGSFEVVASTAGVVSAPSFFLTNLLTQTITFGSLADQTYGNTISLSASASSGLPVTFNVISGPATVSNDVLTVTGVGTVTVEASQAGDGIYGAATPVDQSFSVAPATLTITPISGQSMVYGAAVPTLAYTPSGFINGDAASSLTGALGTTATTTSPVGSYAFTLGTLNAGPNYTVALAANPPTFAVTPAPLTITVNNATKIQGQANPAFTVSYCGFVLGQDASVLGGALTFSTTATTGSQPGTYTVTAGGQSDSNYAITFVPGTLTIISWAQATANLQTQVDAAGLASGQSSFDAQLQAAIAMFNAGDTTDGVRQLDAFINHVSARSGKGITATLANGFIACAQQIISAVG